MTVNQFYCDELLSFASLIFIYCHYTRKSYKRVSSSKHSFEKYLSDLLHFVEHVFILVSLLFVCFSKEWYFIKKNLKCCVKYLEDNYAINTSSENNIRLIVEHIIASNFVVLGIVCNSVMYASSYVATICFFISIKKFLDNFWCFAECCF